MASRVTRTGFLSLEAPAQKGGVVNSTIITQQPPQHTTPASPIDQLPQGIDPNEPIVGGVLSDEKIDKSLLGKIVSTFSGGVSTFMGTPKRNNNANSDNSETSSVPSDNSNIFDFQGTSKTNKDLRYTQQNLERIKTEIENQYRIQVAIEKKNFEKEIQNYYHNHFKTIESEHKEKLSTTEAKIAEQINNEIKSIKASAEEQNTKHLETIEMLQQKVKKLTQVINQTPSPNLATPPPFPLTNQSMFYNQSMLNDSVVQMVDKFEKSILIQDSAMFKVYNKTKHPQKNITLAVLRLMMAKIQKSSIAGWIVSIGCLEYQTRS